ncbi:MAG: hypothetical protein IT457_16560 [Planctomycetes bacterium]|nr:hypothetical protein [Planctomycetota bacterium]
MLRPVSALACLACASALAAQAPDVLIPSGSLDGIYRLVDRNGSGFHTDDGDAYDYVLNGFDSSIRNVVYVTTPSPRLWCTTTVAEQILSFWDANANGTIEPGEITVALDLPSHFASADHEINGIAHSGNGVFWFTNNSGAQEGIWRCEDLNGDLDFADVVLGVSETRPAAVEPATVVVGNAVAAGSPTLALTALDSIEFDPTHGPFGRFLCEEENFDFTVAFEDGNGDGDFLDPGECYLFSALYNGGTIGAAANPDVVSGALPVCNEVLSHAVDTSTTPPTHYLLSFDTTATQLDAALVLRGRDLNADGDVNDAGEVNVYWDGSLDSTGAVAAYNFCYGMHAEASQVWIAAEWDGAIDEEHLLHTFDLDFDGNANDPGEASVTWRLPVDRTQYEPLVLPAGTLPAAPAGLPGTYAYFGAASCPSSLPGSHNVQIGSDNWNDKVLVGNPNFVVRTWGANPVAAGIYNLGIAPLPTPLPIDPPANLCNVYLLGVASLGFVTDATGVNDSVLAIPAQSSLVGGILYWQSIVLDPISPLGVTTSDAAWTRFGTYSYSVN